MIFKDIWLGIKTVQERNSATRSALGIFFLYQEIHVLIWHRFAHWSYNHRMLFVARLILQAAHFFTPTEIHPGARLNRGILISHGCGMVVGETAVVDDNYTIYQGATLSDMGTKKGKRRPTLGNSVVIGTDAKILGAFEVGDSCFIAANAVLPKPLEDNVTAVDIPARPIKKDGVTIPKEKKNLALEEYETMKRRMEQMEREIDFPKSTLKETQFEKQPTQEKIYGK